jgi:hypothetical protein
MIEVVLQVLDAADEQLVREMVGDRRGIEVAGVGEPSIDERADVGTLVMQAWPAVDFYTGRPPRTPGGVVLNAASDERVHAYEATVTRIDRHYTARKLRASWIVSYPHFAPTPESPGAGPAMVLAPGRAPRPLTDEEGPYTKLLNVLEIMEQHNAAGAQPAIRRAGIQAILEWLPGLLLAYGTYRERVLTGAYRP